MNPAMSAVERRLDELLSRLRTLEEMAEKDRAEFADDSFVRDVVERNFEVAIQCCLDIANRIISIERTKKPSDYRGSLLKLGELGVIPQDFARRIAPLAGFRNVLVHEYADIDWDEVYGNLDRIDDLREFARHVGLWLKQNTDD